MNNVDIAQICHEANRAYCKTLGDDSQPAWEDAPDWQKQSIINGVNFHMDNPKSTPEQSHENWLAEKVKQGWRYGTEKDAEKKSHPCFMPYFQLPTEQRRKDAIFVAIVRACAD